MLFYFVLAVKAFILFVLLPGKCQSGSVCIAVPPQYKKANGSVLIISVVRNIWKSERCSNTFVGRYFIVTHSDKIITGARQYCLDLFQSGLRTKQWIAKELLNGIEYLVGKQFLNVDDLKEEIKRLSLISLDEQTSGYKKNGYLKKIEAERQKFLDFIDCLDVTKLDEVKQLPYRRRLSESESTLVKQNLKKNWNFDGWVAGEYYWEPLPLVSISPKPFCFYNTEILSDTDYQNIISLLLTLNSDTIYEVTEDRLDYEIEASEFDKGSIETAYTDKENSWIIYLSHEGTIAFGGQQLMEELDIILVDKTGLKNKW